VRTRARSYIDNDPHNHNVDNVNPLRRRTFNYAKAPDKSTDGDLKYIAVTQSELPVLAVGGISFAQTYEGTTAAASSDSIALSSRGRLGTPQGTTIAAGSAVTWVGALVAANPHAKTSMAVSTAQRLGALAAAGVADGDMSLAQVRPNPHNGPVYCLCYCLYCLCNGRVVLLHPAIISLLPINP
jgi:hypothetical protein